MTKVKVAFFETKPWEKNYLEVELAKKLPNVEAIFTESPLDKNNLHIESDFALCSIFLDSHIDGETLKALPNLKFIATRSTGFDHIDIETAATHNTIVSNVPFYGENTVAEYAFALLLALTRRIYDAYHRVREDGRFSFDGLQGVDLKGKTLGVIGTGHIGCHIIKIAKGFDMRVVAFDPHPDQNFANDCGFPYQSFEEVLRQSDVLTLHVPYNDHTHHLINEAAISLMKPTAYLINTSRGGIVDTEALVLALKEKRLAGAGLDVLEEEGIIKDELNFLTKGHSRAHELETALANHVLIDMPNVIVTPHNAFNTKEALERILDTTIDNIAAFINNKPINIVKPL